MRGSTRRSNWRRYHAVFSLVLELGGGVTEWTGGGGVGAVRREEEDLETRER